MKTADKALTNVVFQKGIGTDVILHVTASEPIVNTKFTISIVSKRAKKTMALKGEDFTNNNLYWSVSIGSIDTDAESIILDISQRNDDAGIADGCHLYECFFNGTLSIEDLQSGGLAVITDSRLDTADTFPKAPVYIYDVKTSMVEDNQPVAGVMLISLNNTKDGVLSDYVSFLEQELGVKMSKIIQPDTFRTSIKYTGMMEMKIDVYNADVSQAIAETHSKFVYNGFEENLWILDFM